MSSAALRSHLFRQAVISCTGYRHPDRRNTLVPQAPGANDPGSADISTRSTPQLRDVANGAYAQQRFDAAPGLRVL
jgi:hypothetical protein